MRVGSWRRTAVAIAVLLALAGLGGWLAMGMIDRVVFQPTRGSDVDAAELAARGIAAEELFLETEDGVRIHAWYLPAAGPPLDLTLLFFHGNAGNASHRLPNAAQLARLGVDVLLPDYRGYGRSEGRPSEAGVYADARAALAHATRDRGRPLGRVALFGRSLGGVVAVDLARDRPLAGVVLESTFTSVADVARMTFGFAFGPLTRGRFAAVDRIGGLRSPVLFVHGNADTLVPIDLGRRLYRRAPEPKRFETIEGAGHNDLVFVGGAPYFELLRTFLRSL